MKNSILKKFIILTLMLLQAPVFCEDSSAGSYSSSSIVAAIKAMQVAVVNALQGSGDSSIVNALNKIFVRDRDNGSSLIDKKIDAYTNNFYSLYAGNYASGASNTLTGTVEISGQVSSGDTDNETSTDNASAVNDLASIEKKVKVGTKNLIQQDINYDTQKTLASRASDILALLLIKAEGAGNNIDPNTTLSSNITLANAAGVNTGGINNSKVTIDNGTQDILDANVLVGQDSYYGDAANDAKLFLNQLMQGFPPPKVFYFPSPSASGGSVQVYYPYADTSNGTSYTISQNISTASPENCGATNKGCIPSPCSCDSDYSNMLKMVNANPQYQAYKMKTRSKIAMRTLFLGNVFHIFQERYKDKKGDKSLIEKEREMAFVGLTQKYYADLKTKSVAEVNLETLHTLNKIVYFLYKLHQDNDRALLVSSISGLHGVANVLDLGDEKQYLQPVGSLIDNACWAQGANDSIVSTRAVASDKRASVCKGSVSS